MGRCLGLTLGKLVLGPPEADIISALLRALHAAVAQHICKANARPHACACAGWAPIEANRLCHHVLLLWQGTCQHKSALGTPFRAVLLAQESIFVWCINDTFALT